jgi:fructose-1-phosphate kinase PfkB-like protein
MSHKDNDSELKRTLHNFYSPSKDYIKELTKRSAARNIENSIISYASRKNKNLEMDNEETNILKPKIRIEKDEQEMMIKIIKKLCTNYRIEKNDIF